MCKKMVEAKKILFRIEGRIGSAKLSVSNVFAILICLRCHNNSVFMVIRDSAQIMIINHESIHDHHVF